MAVIEDLWQYATPLRAVVAVVVLLVGWHYANSYLEERKIISLGGHAPARSSWYPYSVDLIWEMVKAGLNNTNYEMWVQIFKKRGNNTAGNPYTVEVKAGGRRIIFTADPENIKAILATQFNDYGKGERFRQEWHDFLGDSIFTTDGRQWHDSRQLIRPQFIKDRVSDLDIFETHVNNLLPLMGEGKTVDAADLFFRYTLDAATDFLLGQSVDSLHNPAIDFADAFTEVQHVQSIITRAGPLNWLVPRKSFFAGLKTIDRFIKPYIAQVGMISKEELEKQDRYTFLHALAGYTKDQTVLRDQLYAVLLAGRDTTACTLSWTIYELARKPQVVSKLRQEILDVVGPDRAPTYENLKAMKYLQSVMNETLRLYPVVPFNVRLALKDTTLPHGAGPDGLQPVGVPAGTPIGYSTLIMQRREDIYPAENTGFAPPGDFVPERWNNWTPKPWTYVPFNGGPRLCVGQQFALTEMGYTLVRMFQKYSSLELKMSEEPGMKMDIVLQPLNGVHVAFHKASQSEK